MALTLAEIAAAVKQLSPEDRERLLFELSEDLPEVERKRIESLWVAEIRQREQLRRGGKSTARPVDDALRDIQTRLDAKYRH